MFNALGTWLTDGELETCQVGFGERSYTLLAAKAGSPNNPTEFLVERTRHTRRFARYVGRRCATSTIKDVAEELLLGWDAVKELDK